MNRSNSEFGRAIANPDLTATWPTAPRVLREAQDAGRAAAVYPAHAADALLALTDSLSSHLLQELHTPDEALAVLRDHLNHLFGRLST